MDTKLVVELARVSIIEAIIELKTIVEQFNALMYENQ
jgi:hypothetical protein